MGKIMAVNISEKKGTQKKNVHSARLMEEFGIEKDAHAGKWHRQVSLLSYEKIEEFKAKGAPVKDGAFGENLIVQGFDFKTLPVGTRSIWRKPDCKWIRSEGIAGWHQTSQRRGIIRSDTDREKMS